MGARVKRAREQLAKVNLPKVMLPQVARKSDRELRFATRAIHAGQEPDPMTGAVTTPIHVTSTYAQVAPGIHKGYDYSRTDNPMRTALQTALASLESARL